MSAREIPPGAWRVVTWSSKTTQVFPTRNEALEYLRANDTDGDWHIERAEVAHGIAARPLTASPTAPRQRTVMLDMGEGQDSVPATVNFVRDMATPPPAPVLSDAEILALWSGSDIATRPVLGSKKVIAFARAILGRASRGAK